MVSVNAPGQATIQFLRDVGINVLANLVAAAAIYLGGVLFGVFPSRGLAVVVSAAILLLAANAGFLVVALRFFNRDVRYWRLIAIATATGTLATAITWAGFGADGWSGPAIIVLGVLSTVWFASEARSGRRRQAGHHEPSAPAAIRGMSWIDAEPSRPIPDQRVKVEHSLKS
jgi:hypothetical protein